MELLSGLPWATITPSTLWFATVWLFTRLILSGRLIPAEVHDREMASKDASVQHYRTQSERWHEAWQIETTAHSESRRQVSDLTRGAETTRYLLDTLQAKAPKDGDVNA